MMTYKRNRWDRYTLEGRFQEKCEHQPEVGCRLWTASKNAFGYGQLWVKEYGRAIGAHRVSWLLHRGNIPEGMCVLHKCDVPACVNPEHLFLGTKKENTADMLNKGRGKTRYTFEDLEEIREAEGSVKDAAERFGCSLSLVYQVRRGDYSRC